MFRICLLLGLTAMFSSAQPALLSIRGSVSCGGSLVPNASVIVSNESTSQSQTVSTNQAGEFQVQGLQPGAYTIQVRARGCLTSEQSVTLAVGKSERLEFFLNPPVAAKATPPIRSRSLEADPDKFVTVPIFYATDRKKDDISKPASFYGTERNRTQTPLEFGICEVTIPWSHHVGELESPAWWKVDVNPDPEQHVMLLSVTPYDEDRYFSKIKDRLAGVPAKEAFVFIHGYNTSFENAARRTAQMAHDLKFTGAPILYSWPSQGDPRLYPKDETQVEWTGPHLEEFLQKLADRTGATTIHLIAHSMGTQALTSALQSLPVRTTPLFREVILAAPDIDADIFVRMASKFKGKAGRITLYASSKDIALNASRQFHGEPRAGESKQMVVVAGVDSIDASLAETDVLGHGYLFRSSILLDIDALFRENKPPQERGHLQPAQLGNLPHWVMKP